MRRGTLRYSAWTLAAFGLAVALSACGDEGSETLGGGQSSGQSSGTSTPTGTATTPPTPEEQIKQILDQRKADYGEALRTASLKLRDELPTLDEIKQIEAAPDDAAKKVAYEKLVDTMIADPKFAKMMVKFWKDTFRTGQVGAVQPNQPNKDTAANFAAQNVVDGKAYTDLFTATAGTCPTFDPATSTFTAADCPQGPAGGGTVGVLTDPGLQAQYFANMAFRRVRFIQETFACNKFPAEISKTPKPMGNGTYTGVNDFNSITGKQNTPTARVDFQDTSAVVCANCHSTLNFAATLFLNYDAAGLKQATPQVELPTPGNPKAAVSDYVPGTTPIYKWRADKTVNDLAGYGAAIAADPEVARCAVNRIWNYAMSRGDIVNDLATVPNVVTDQLTKDFSGGGYKLKETIRAVFKAEDFVKF
ncbi:MAG: DUF1549 domain-containing protein [Deltaproteobacteria bacterium]|nr:DUF1549 domain-containing protein [Deltaproteobacteria bacterium]